MTRPDPLDRFAPWPQHEADVTADALIRHAAVHAHGALALVRAGHDTARQTVRAVKYVAIAQLLMDLRAADPAAAGAAARRLWARLGDGADIERTVARWVHRRSDPGEIARVAVEAYEQRSAQASPGGGSGRAIRDAGGIPPGPWRVGGHCGWNLWIGPPRPGGVDVGRLDNEQLAAHVVTAVNDHDRHRAALREIVNTLGPGGTAPCWCADRTLASEADDALRIAREALTEKEST